MSIPPGFEWLVPLLLPFFMGLIVGVIIKRAIKLLFALAALLILLVVSGSLTLTDVYGKAENILPRIAGVAGGMINLVPYSSGAFLVGLAVGFLLK